MLRHRITAALLAATSLAIPDIATAETVTVARSAKLGIEIKAETDPTGTWCSESATLYLQHGTDSRLIGSEADFFAKLDKVFAAECPAMALATVIVLNADGVETGRFHIAKSAGWGNVPEQQTQMAGAAAAAGGAQSASPAERSTATPAAAKPVPLDRELLHLLRLKFDPKAREDRTLLKQMVAEIYCDEARDVKDEFARQDFFEAKIPLLLSRIEGAPTFVRLARRGGEIGEYDFSAGHFPYRAFNANAIIKFNSRSIGNCRELDLDDYFEKYLITLPPFAPVESLRMNEQEARDFNNLISSNRSLRRDRTYVFIDIDLSRATSERRQSNTNRTTEATFFEGTIRQIVASLDEEQQYVVARVSESEIKERMIVVIREVEEAERERQRLGDLADKARREAVAAKAEADADALYDRLMVMDAPERLAYIRFGSARIDQANQALASAAVTGETLPHTLVFRTGTEARQGWRAAWPANLTVEDPTLESDTWYVAQGNLRAEETEDGHLMAFFATTEAARCEGDPCATSDAEVRRFVADQHRGWTGYSAVSSPTE